MNQRGVRGGRQISDKYALGEELGKGGFGTVYACLNRETGETVAVKSIGLRNLNKESLNLIEQEVSLLKNLDHPNIVKYIDTVRTQDHLHIVLEYMENGSLARNLKLFGTLSQSLCALYIRQVLHGLAYLHDQGVIHRDIKGANILTTKQGLVKLADFGVATHTSAQTNEVVGTPYWMAPEVIEMDRPTTACDIWSVGCTIIELLTLKPPYFDIPPMAALYRIVQDEYPPLPEGLSPALKEFLLLCFKKEPLLRSSAKDLLRHRWVHKARGVHEPKFVRADGVTEEDDDATTDLNVEESARNSIATITKKDAAAPRKSSSSKPIQQRKDSANSHGTNNVGEAEYAIRQHEAAVDEQAVSEKQRTLWRRSVMNTIRLSEEQRAAGLREQKELEEKAKRQEEEQKQKKQQNHDDDEDDDDDDEDEDWDDWDHNDGLEAAVAARRKRQTNEDNNDGIDPEDFDLGFDPRAVTSERGKQIQEQFRAMIGSRNRSFGKESENNSENKIPTAQFSVGEFDLDDLDGAFGEDHQKVPTLVTNEHDTQHIKIESKLAKFRESDDMDDGSFFDLSDQPTVTSDVAEALKLRMTESGDKRDKNNNSNGDFADGDDDDEEYRDPFLDEFEDDDKDFVEDSGQLSAARQTEEVEKLINLLRPDQDAETILKACSKLQTLFREQPAQRRTLLTHHGVLPIMEMLELSNADVLHAVLKVVGQIIENDREFQELLSLAGLIPVVAKFCRPSVSRPIRLQAAGLVKQFLTTSSVTLQMLVACGGLPILAGLLIPCEESDEQHPDIALGCVAVDGIKCVFELSSSTGGRGGGGAIPKNDFCRLFAKEGVLKQLVALLEYCRSPEGEAECAVLGFQSHSLMVEVAEVLQVFTLGDSIVKQNFAHDHAVLEGVLRTLTLEAPFHAEDAQANRRSKQRHSKKNEVLVGKSGNIAMSEEEIGPLVKTLLKCIKNLCMEPTVLETLEIAGAIPTLVPFLSYCSNMSKLANNAGEAKKDAADNKNKHQKHSKRAGRVNSYVPGKQLSAAQEQMVKEVQNLVMLSMFYLCRLSRSRQEQAAVSGIIPYLMDAITTRSPVKTFALQILTDFAHTSDLTRDMLYRNQGLEFFLDLLVSGDVFWQEKAFVSLSACLSNSTPEVERAMLRPLALQRLVSLFQSAQSNSFEFYVKELLGMLSCSSQLAECIGRSGLFMSELVARLSFPKTEVRLNLLKILKIIADRHEDLEYFLLEYNLFPVVTRLAKQAQDSHRVLVMQLTTQMLEEWRTQILG